MSKVWFRFKRMLYQQLLKARFGVLLTRCLVLSVSHSLLDRKVEFVQDGILKAVNVLRQISESILLQGVLSFSSLVL